MQRETELFTREDADSVFCTLGGYCEKRGNSVMRSRKYYKLTVEFMDNDVALTTNIEIKRVSEEEKGGDVKCVEFVRVKGDFFLFYEVFREMSEYLGGLVYKNECES